jgi:hypothetical protein
VLDGFVSAVEAVATSIAVPVSSLELLLSLDDTDNVAVVTAPQYLQS